jgi:hypothetical protein
MYQLTASPRSIAVAPASRPGCARILTLQDEDNNPAKDQQANHHHDHAEKDKLARS